MLDELLSKVNVQLFGADLQGTEHEWLAAGLVCARCMLRRWSPHVAAHVAVELARGNVVQMGMYRVPHVARNTTPPPAVGAAADDTCDHKLLTGQQRALLWRAAWVGATLPLIALSISQLRKR